MPADLTPGPDAPPANDLTKRTPCRKFDVAALTDHLLDSITSIGTVAGAQIPERDSAESVERQVIAAARPALDAGILSLEFLVHAWDYAAATDGPIRVPDSLSEYVIGGAQRVNTPDTRGTAGFDDPVGCLPTLARWTG